jgi:hypothetical protein
LQRGRFHLAFLKQRKTVDFQFRRLHATARLHTVV